VLAALGLVASAILAAPLPLCAAPSIAVPLPAPPAPSAASDLRRSVEARLRAVETPPGADELRALGPGVADVLLALAVDPRVEILVRARATSALGFFPTAAVRERLLAMLAPAGKGAPPGPRGDLLLARKAALALGWQAAGVKEVAILLEHADAEVRMDAAFALGLTRLPEAVARLRGRSLVEKDTRVQRQIERQLRILDEALAKDGAKGRGKDGPEADARDRGPPVIEPPDPRRDPMRPVRR
jgi:hypothetical protein